MKARSGWVVVVAAAALLAAVAGARLVGAKRVEPAERVAYAFIERAVAGDSVALSALSADVEPVLVALAIHREQPEALQAFARTMQRGTVRRWRDSVLVGYRSDARFCPAELPEPEMQFQLARHEGAWRVYYMGGVC